MLKVEKKETEINETGGQSIPKVESNRTGRYNPYHKIDNTQQFESVNFKVK